MILNCPCHKCGNLFEVDDELLGQDVICPTCGEQCSARLTEKKDQPKIEAAPPVPKKKRKGITKDWWFPISGLLLAGVMLAAWAYQKEEVLAYVVGGILVVGFMVVVYWIAKDPIGFLSSMFIALGMIGLIIGIILVPFKPVAGLIVCGGSAAVFTFGILIQSVISVRDELRHIRADLAWQWTEKEKEKAQSEPSLERK
jgi:hypothetical protein